MLKVALQPVGLIRLHNLMAFLGTLCALHVLGHPLSAVAEAATSAGPLKTLCLSGTDWRIHADADGKGIERQMFAADCASPDWLPASVPGNIQADLETAHLLKPWSYGAGDPRLYEVAEKDWWYRKDFAAPSSFTGQRLTLVFEGVDHECEVWLNGRQARLQCRDVSPLLVRRGRPRQAWGNESLGGANHENSRLPGAAGRQHRWPHE